MSIERFLSSRPISERLQYQLYGARLPFLATGGIETTSEGYRIHTFTTVGSSSFQVINGSTNVEVTIMGGGGGGGTGNGQWAAGGGGAGFLQANFSVSPGTYSIDVGAAGPGQTVCNNANWTTSGSGGNSTFSTLIAGGGKGGNSSGISPTAGAGGTNTTTGASVILKNYSGQTPAFSSGDFNNAGGHNGLRNSEGLTTYGSGAAGVANGNPGTHATGNGNGGAGGPSCQGGHRGGGNGSPGFVIVRYLI